MIDDINTPNGGMMPGSTAYSGLGRHGAAEAGSPGGDGEPANRFAVLPLPEVDVAQVGAVPKAALGGAGDAVSLPEGVLPLPEVSPALRPFATLGQALESGLPSLVSMEAKPGEPSQEAKPGEEVPKEAKSAEVQADEAKPTVEKPEAGVPGGSEPGAKGADAPTEGDKGEAARAYWKSVLTGDPDTVPAEVRRRAGADDPSLPEEQRNYLLYSAINRSWVADHQGQSQEEVMAHWPEIRAKLAAELGAGDSEQEVFLGLSERETDAPRREAVRQIYTRAWQAGVQQTDFDVEDWRARLSPKDSGAADALANAAYEAGRALRQKHSGLVKDLVRGLDAYIAAEEDTFSAPRVFAAVPELASAVDRLPELPEEERNVVMWLAAEELRKERKANGADKEGMFGRTVRAVRRNAIGIGFNAMQAAGHMGIATLHSVGNTLGGRAGGALNRGADKWDQRMQTLHELRLLATGEVVPLAPPDASKAEEYFLVAAESVPSAILACCGGMGFAALTAAGTGEAVAEARRRSPQTPQELQFAAGVVGGAIQASIYMGLSRIGGKVLERSISDFMAAKGAGLARYSVAGLRALEGMTAEGVSLLLAGKAAAAADLATQELASRAAQTASNIGWKEFGDNLTDIEANMREAASLLPFLLISSGRVALRHFRSPRAVLGEGRKLLDWGAEERQVTQLMRERNVGRQGDMLTEMLRSSRRWAFPGFLNQVVKAMGLLNIEYFDGFKNKDVVRDFLNLPSEASLAGLKESEHTPLSTLKMARHPGHGAKRFHLSLKPERVKTAMRLWDEWWSKSHYTAGRVYPTRPLMENVESSRRLRIESYMRINQNPFNVVPNRMRPYGAYAPFAEQERRALLRDRVKEAQDLSYQFIMQIYPLDMMSESDVPLDHYRSYGDISRNMVLGEVAKAVMRTVTDKVGRVESLRNLDLFFRDFYASENYHKGIPETLHKTPIEVPDYPANGKVDWVYSFLPRYGLEEQESFRIMTGMRACANTLIDLLPMMDDFQTALARGMTPGQAYHHLLVRELEFDPSAIEGYPLDKLAEQRNVTPLANTKRNMGLCQVYTKLTGYDFESSPGEDGRTYWRLKRPDGTYSRWHYSCDQAANDVAFNAALTFMAFGDGANVRWQRSGASSRFDLSSIPVAGSDAFSGYDQLCSQAVGDLSQFWFENGTRLQPGMRFTLPEGARFSGVRGKDGITPWIRETDMRGQTLYFDSFTVASPLALAQGRFLTWWNRALSSGVLSSKQAAQFLQQEGRMTEQEAQELFSTPLVSKPGKIAQWRRLKTDITVDKKKINSVLSDALASYTTLYFVANLNRLELPVSVKEWFAMAAFSPAAGNNDAPAKPGKRKTVKVGQNRSGVVQWSNRQTAIRLQEMADEVDAFRKSHGEAGTSDPFMQSLFDRALGVDAGTRYEQGWGLQIAGPGSLQFASQSFMHLLQMPRLGWESMSPAEREDIRAHVEAFCKQDPAPLALDELARGGSPDVVQAAIDNLDEQLGLYPELHRYAPVADDLQRVRVLMPNEVMPDMSQEQEPLDRPMGISDPTEAPAMRDSIYKAYALPEFLQGNANAAHALRFLDVMRHYAVSRPYTLGDGIWWRNRLYGGFNGQAPSGLGQWIRSEPLMPLRNLLEQLYLRKMEDGKALRVCGNYLEGLPPDRLDPRELKMVTVYRSPLNLDVLYRLMPGDADSPNFLTRSPYVVGSRMGVYLMERGKGIVKKDADMPLVYVPLHKFDKNFWRVLADKTTLQWREYSIRNTLNYVLWRAERVRGMRNPASGVANMTELALRLFEDTGFSRSLDGINPENLTNSQGWLLRLAADIFNCLHVRQDRYYSESREAYNQLSRTAQALRKSEDAMQRVINTLMESNADVSKKSDIFSKIKPDVEDEFDRMEQEAAPRSEAEVDNEGE